MQTTVDTSSNMELDNGIQAAIREEIERSSVVRKFLPILRIAPETTTVPAGLWIEDDEAGKPLGHVYVDQGPSIPVVEIYAEFRLTEEQLAAEERDRNVLSLVRRATRDLASLEDSIALRGCVDPDTVDLPESRRVRIVDRDAADGTGVLSAGPESKRETVPSTDESFGQAPAGGGSPPGGNDREPVQSWREATGHKGILALRIVKEVESATDILHENGAQPPFVLVLRPDELSELRIRVSLHADGTRLQVTPIDALPADVTNVFASRAVKPRRGLVVALGGSPADLMMPRESYELFLDRIDEAGRRVFRLRHRFAIRLKRPKSVYKLNFQQS